jgi:peptidoglycan/xylan/chitin deacetylase (PgdA/CDA1 family)
LRKLVVLGALAIAVALALVAGAWAAYPPGQTPKTGDRVTIGPNAWHPENQGHTATIMRVDVAATQVEATVDNPAGGAARAIEWFVWSEVTPIGANPTPTPTPGPTATPTPIPTATPTPTPTPNPVGCANGYTSLSFDDGPTGLTRQYVDAFVAKGAKAMFFMQGNHLQERPGDAAYVASKGMLLGDHTFDHPDLATLTNAQVTSQLSRQKTIAQNQTGQVEQVFRPPFGSYKASTYDLGNNLNMSLVSWTHDTKDYEDPPTTQTVNFVLNNAKNQTIFLMHDGHPNTLAAIPRILDGLKAKGLCVGKIIPSNTSIPNEWGDPQFVKVVAF